MSSVTTGFCFSSMLRLLNEAIARKLEGLGKVASGNQVKKHKKMNNADSYKHLNFPKLPRKRKKHLFSKISESDKEE